MKLPTIILAAVSALFWLGQQLHAQSNVDTNKLAEIRAKAEKGDVQAECDLGSAYAFSKFGLKQDWTNAMVWFRKAAEQNNAEAECRLGTGYDFGVGLEKNLPEALKWYQKSADQNFVEAYWRLGCNCDGSDAVKWFSKAADQNFIPAQGYLAGCYYRGRGVEKDLVEAYKWYLMVDEASPYHDDHYPGQWANFMSGLKASLSPEQIAEAKRRVAEWRAQHNKVPPNIGAPKS